MLTEMELQVARVNWGILAEELTHSCYAYDGEDLFPTDVVCQTTNTCTRHCPWCFHGYHRVTDLHIMPMELFEQLVWQIRALGTVERLFLHLLNEPLSDPLLADRVRLSKRVCPATAVSVVTNGDLLSVVAAKKLLDSGLDSLSVNRYEAQDSSPFDRRIPELSTKISVRYGRLEDSQIDNRGGLLAGRLPEVVSDSCARPFTQVAIWENGDITLCCVAPSRDLVFGNVRDGLIRGWNSPAMKALRMRLALRQRHGTACELCSVRGMVR